MKISLRTGYVCLAFVALFTYFYPVALKFLPVDTGILLHMCALVYFVVFRDHRLDRRFYSVFLWTVPLLLSAWIATAIVNTEYDFSLLTKLLATFLYAFSAIMVVDLIKKATVRFSVYTVLEWMVYAAVVQASLSLVLFLNPDLMNLWLGAVRQSEVAESIAQGSASFRLMAIAKTQYASMAVMYGIALFSAIALAFSGKSNFYKKRKILYFGSLLLICVAGVLSARTFFLILFLAFFYFCYLLWKRKGVSSILYIVATVGVTVCLFFAGLSTLENSAKYGKTYRWAFEWYINLSRTGKLETSSTDDLQNMYIFPDNFRTWLIGDGRLYLDNGAFYMGTDAGYVRNLFYWGLLGTFVYYLIQYIYYRLVRSATSDKAVRRLLTVLVVWLFIYNVKDMWQATIYWMILLAAIVESENKSNSRTYDIGVHCDL